MAKNNFLTQMKQPKTGRGLSAQTLVEESGTGDILNADQAAAEGRLLALNPDQLEPDPRQPRRTFDPDSILALQKDIETNGQLQPILVGKPNPDGKYPIIFGERRWRAIRASKVVETVSAILRKEDLDDSAILLFQISENTQREDITAVEQAHAIAQFVKLCKEQGHNKNRAADLLHMSQARVSKYLALAAAPEEIQDLSNHGEIQDVELLYSLKKANEEKPKETTKLLEKWRANEVSAPLRQAVSQLLEKPGAGAAGQQQAGGGEPELDHRPTNNSPATANAVQRASAIDVQSTDTDTHLIIDVGKKKQWYSLPTDVIRHLKELVRKL